jgi:transcriptional regulator with XRE-family HTH domain
MRLAIEARSADLPELADIFEGAYQEELQGLGEYARAIRSMLQQKNWTQQEFANLAGLSMSAVARLANGADPSVSTAQRLAEFAKAQGFDKEALTFMKVYIPYLSLSPDEKRESDLYSAFMDIFRQADSATLDQIEAFLSRLKGGAGKTVPLDSPWPTDFLAVSEESDDDTQFLRRLLSTVFQDEVRLSMLCAFVWLLIVPGENYYRRGAALRILLTNRIATVLEERTEPLSAAESYLLGDLGPRATALAAEWREATRRAAGLTLPLAIKRVREELPLSKEELAEELGVSTSKLEQFESGAVTPDVTVLGRFETLPGALLNRHLSTEFLFIERFRRKQALNDATKVSETVATLESTTAALDRMTLAFDLIRAENERLTKKLAELDPFGAFATTTDDEKERKRERTH